MSDIKFSALSLAPIREGQADRDAIDDMVALAQKLDGLDYECCWIAEHHNALNLVSSATSLLIQHTLEHTHNIKVGSDGIMPPDHALLVVAERFGTLETIYPNCVDLGLGRAPGTDMITASALRRNQHNGVYAFSEEVEQLQTYFDPGNKQAYVRAYPVIDKNVPLYILGSSTDSAHLAARKGLPYVFAGHFAPQQMKEVIKIYHDLSEPSGALDKPYVIVCLNTIVTETGKEAEYLASSLAQVFISVARGGMQPVQLPTDDLNGLLAPRKYEMAKQRFDDSLIGSEETIKAKLEAFLEEYGDIDKIMAVNYIYDQDKQFESYERSKRVIQKLNK